MVRAEGEKEAELNGEQGLIAQSSNENERCCRCMLGFGHRPVEYVD